MKLRKAAAWLLALMLLVSLLPGTVLADDYTVDDVKAMIELLPNFTDVTEDDRDAIETAQAAYDSLSAEDQDELDTAVGSGYAYNTSQPYGRVLEIAVWGLLSLDGVDDETTLPDGTYDESTTPALSSEYSKGKSSSARQRAWSVKEVVVKDGRASATLTVESSTYAGVYVGGTYYERTNTDGDCEFAGVPIDLNGTLYFAGDSTSMPVPIAFTLTTSIDESYVPDTPDTPDDDGSDAPGVSAAPPLKDGELTINNTVGMFKAASASLTTTDGKTSLIMALNGTGYENLYKGTYAEAVQNGSNRANWIQYTTNADGKYEFVIPLDDGQTYIPIVSISTSYVKKYEAGENPIERAFFPRQLTIDAEAKTLTVAEYDETVTVSVSSSTDLLSVEGTAPMRIVGGPNSNNFNVVLTLKMKNDLYSSVTYPTVTDGEVGTAEASLSGDKTFEINMLNAPNKTAFKDGEAISLTFRCRGSNETLPAALTVDTLNRTAVLADASGASSVFRDVPADAYYADAVTWALKKGITNGMTEDTFAPNEPCTRGQIVTFLWRAADSPKATGQNPFTDVKESDYYYEAVLWAAEKGITNGVAEKSFAPGASCTRGQAMMFMWRAADKPAASGQSVFTDVQAGSECGSAVDWAVEKGITNGVAEKSFAPNDSCTRGQIVTFLYREDSAK